MNFIAQFDLTSHTSLTGTARSGEVYIMLYDAGTGAPVNGNNVVVTVEVNQDGYIYLEEITVAGQSASCYNGKISDSNPYYYTSFIALSFSAVPAQAPPVNICDLAVSYISIDKQESSPGARDAQFTIHATSSYQPLYYSNDFGKTWQVSPTFTNLGGGLVQALVKDSNPLGCQQEVFGTILILSNILAADPGLVLAGGNTSRWNAAFNPVVFTYQRKDIEVAAVQLDNASGKALICTNSALNSSITGSMVYMNAAPYIGLFTVLSAENYVGQMLIDTPFNGTATGYVNINGLRPYYQVQTQITYQDPSTGQQSTITSTNRPDSTGIIKADISNFLQSLLQAKDGSDYTQINYRDSNLSASYIISYAEYWDGKLAAGQTLTFNQVADPYYVLYAAKQLGEQYGGNLAAYVPFRNVPAGTPLAKWVTDFAEPAYSNGYPFDIGFIYSDDLVGLQLCCNLLPLDINRNPVGGGEQNSYLLNDDGTWLLNQDGSRLIIAKQSSANTPVPAQLGLNRLLISQIFDPQVCYFSLAIMYYDSNSNLFPVTQTQVIRIDDAVDDHSVYLRWIGLTGSWNYYRFVYNQEVSLDVQNAVIIKNYVSDWENQDSIEDVIAKSAGQKMKVMAEDLSVADIRGLQSIKYSPKVQMLINSNPVKWQTIVINTATYSEYDTRNGQAPFSITFNMPSINIQTQ